MVPPDLRILCELWTVVRVWVGVCVCVCVCVYLVELDALLRHSGPGVLKTEDPELSLHQVGGVLFHRGHVKCQPSEVRVEVCMRDDVCKTGESTAQ